MKTILRISAGAIRYGTLAALFGTAAVSAAVRFWFLPEIDVFKGRLEQTLGPMAGEHIRIGELSASIRTGVPELVLREVVVLDDEGGEGLRIGEIRIGISPIASLRAGDLRVAWLQLKDAPLSLRRTENGAFVIQGLHEIETIPAWLRTLGAFRISHCPVDWQDVQRGGAKLDLGEAELYWINGGQHQRLGGHFIPPAATAASIRAGFDLHGDLFQPESLSGLAFLEARHFALPALDDELPEVFDISSGHADVQVWGSVEAGRFDRLAARIGGRELRVEAHSSEASAEGLALVGFSGDLFWRGSAEAWRIGARRLKLVSAGHEWPLSRMDMAVTEGSGGAGKSVIASADELVLDDLAPLWSMLRLPGAAPSGRLSRTRLGYEDAENPRFALCTAFGDVVLPAQDDRPGIAGLDGLICGSGERGAALIGITDGALDLAGVLEEPILLKRAGMRLDWQWGSSEWVLRAERASLETADWSAAGEFVLGGGAGGLKLGVQAALGASEVSKLKRYLPARAFPQLSRWLEHSLEHGRLDGARIRFDGPVAAFPFRKGEGTFEAIAGFSGAQLRYAQDWPEIGEARGTVRFAGASLEIDVPEARIAGGEIKGVKAQVADLDKESSIRIDGKVSATVAQCLEFFRTTPLKPVADRLDAVLTAKGQAAIDLALKVPLESKGPPLTVAGKAQLSQTRIEFDGLAEPVENAKGELVFAGDGLVSGKMQGAWLGQAITGRVYREGGALGVDVSGQLAVPALKAQFRNPAWEYLAGSIPLNLSLKLPIADDRGGSVPVSLSSDLAGTRVVLPAPLGKPAGERRALRLDTRLGGGRRSIGLSYGSDVLARFDLAGDGVRLQGIQLAVGADLPKSGETSGLRILIRSPSLELAPWGDVLASASTGDGAGLGMDLKLLDVQLGQALWEGKPKGPVAVQAAARPGGFKGTVDSDYVKGLYEADMAGGKLSSVRADLDFLKVSRLDEKAVATTDSWLDTLHPGSLPALDLVGRHVLWQGFDIGQLRAKVATQARGIMLRSASLRSDNHELTVEQGEWTRQGKVDTTRVSGKLHVKDSGMLATVLGYPDLIRDTPADVDYKLSWAETPFGASAASLAGEVGMTLGKGALLKVDVGLGRFLGLFNVGALWRRLSLDFSDLFGAGMAYDGIAGQLNIADGQARTKGFLIDGVAAKIIINGRVKLATREVDQVVTVIPNTSIALPVAGVLMGGPLGPAVGAAVGAGVFVADKMMGGQVERLAQTRYRVKGSLDNPVITRATGDTPED